MTFNEAYKQMENGAAVARPNWKAIDFWFIDRDRIWAKYKDGAVRPIGFVSGGCCDRDDWFVVKVESLPATPAPIIKTVRGIKRVAPPLAVRQAEMKRRWLA